MAIRAPVPTFQLANPLYAGGTVTFYTVDDDGEKTSTKATLYDAATGSGTLANPVKLDGEGKFQTIPYVETPVIGEITGIAVSGHDTAIISVPGRWRGTWATATLYYAGEFVVGASYPYSVYQVDETHTSGTFATDLSNGLLTLAIDVETVTLNAVAASAERFNFDTSTTMADPGSGDVRFNNATLSSVTQIAVSATNAGGADVSDKIASWDGPSTSSDRGRLTITEPGTSNQVEFKINSAVTDNSTWLQIPVTYVGSSGSFASADKLALSFTPTGADGLGDMAKATYDPNDDGVIAVAQGGSGASTAAGARTNFGLGTAATENAASGSGALARDNAVLKIGKQVIGCWGAESIKPQATNGCAALAWDESTTNKVMTPQLSFDAAAIEYAQFKFRAPQGLDESANFTAMIVWMEASGAATHNCVWQIEMQAQGDGDTVDSAWGTAITLTDTGSSGTRRITAEFSTITPGGTWAAGDEILVRVSRKATDGADTLDVDAKLIEVALFGTYAAAVEP